MLNSNVFELRKVIKDVLLFYVNKVEICRVIELGVDLFKKMICLIEIRVVIDLEY